MRDRRQIVVCAACKLRNGTLICGPRHWDMVMHGVFARLYPDDGVRREVAAGAVQGFIDQYGTFLTREDAYQIVQMNGQPFKAERNGSKTQLFSEGLY